MMRSHLDSCTSQPLSSKSFPVKCRSPKDVRLVTYHTYTKAKIVPPKRNALKTTSIKSKGIRAGGQNQKHRCNHDGHAKVRILAFVVTHFVLNNREFGSCKLGALLVG
jgi:hypothetical protein